MEVNNVNQLNNLGGLQQQSLERISTGLSINDAADNAASLSIADSLKMQRSELSQSLQNLNTGIAVSNIADGALTSQIDILSDMRTQVLEAMNGTTSQEGKDAIQNELQKMMENFQNIAGSTTFAGQNLLTNPDGENQFTVATADNKTTIDLPATDTMGAELQTLLNDFSNEGLSNILNKIDSTVDQLQDIRSDFGSTAGQMQSEARNTISAQIDMARANSSLTDIDFGAEVSDFSRSSIMSQVGYLVATQANAVQEQSVRLLS
ncbi:MAG: flagellin [Campylobacterota bacterium]|nr:flagellin [Campylobacterota bacterium]